MGKFRNCAMLKRNYLSKLALIFYFIFLSSFASVIPSHVQVFALEGNPTGPCMAPHDTPTVGGFVGGDANTQTYTAPTGKTVRRICAATKWSSGKIDHSSHYANYSDDCYQIIGIGTGTVTVKRVAETYTVPEWQTGPEAGKCEPLVHLDVFLSSPSSTPTPSATTTPTPAPTATPTHTTSLSTSSTTPSPLKTTSQKSNTEIEGATLDDPTPVKSTSKPTNEPKTGKVLGDQTSSASTETNILKKVTQWWWIPVLVIVIVTTGIWLLAFKKRKPRQ